MTRSDLQATDPRISRALNELADLVLRAYPDTTFQVTSSAEDAAIVHLVARVDVDDPDEVADLVMDRMIEMQIDEGLPIYLIPLRTPERIAMLRKAQKSHSSAHSEYLPAASGRA
ncbi:MAG TPA: hypothetical protein VFH48_21310 [Chloroflexota bacterium]|nr:hypothetical protein [Chloroflexota bacterium]